MISFRVCQLMGQMCLQTSQNKLPIISMILLPKEENFFLKGSFLNKWISYPNIYMSHHASYIGRYFENDVIKHVNIMNIWIFAEIYSYLNSVKKNFEKLDSSFSFVRDEKFSIWLLDVLRLVSLSWLLLVKIFQLLYFQAFFRWLL